jgi:hypothetical protein
MRFRSSGSSTPSLWSKGVSSFDSFGTFSGTLFKNSNVTRQKDQEDTEGGSSKGADTVSEAIYGPAEAVHYHNPAEACLPKGTQINQHLRASVPKG